MNSELPFIRAASTNIVFHIGHSMPKPFEDEALSTALKTELRIKREIEEIEQKNMLAEKTRENFEREKLQLLTIKDYLNDLIAAGSYTAACEVYSQIAEKEKILSTLK